MPRTDPLQRVAIQTRYNLRSSVKVYEAAALEEGREIPDSEGYLLALDSSHLAEKIFEANRRMAPIARANPGTTSEFEWLDPDGNVLAPDKKWVGGASSHRPGDGGSAPIKPKRHGAKRRGGKKSHPPQDGWGAHNQRSFTLLMRAVERGALFSAAGFSVEREGSRTATGWCGGRPHKDAVTEIRRAYGEGRIGDYISHFHRVSCDLGSKYPTLFFDADSRLFAARTSQAFWLMRDAVKLMGAVDALLLKSLTNSLVASEHEGGNRGPHFPAIVGFHRSHSSKPVNTVWSKLNEASVKAFLEVDIVKNVVSWVSSLVRLYFPGVAARYQACIDWHRERYGIEAQFGLFFSFCVNGILAGQKRIHCEPHTDSKNIIGVCVVVVYEIPGSNFDHTKFTWLVIWEAGVIIELPPWVALLYPSSLFLHFNVDISDLRIVITDTREKPTRDSSVDITNSGDRSRETDSASLAEAKRKGHSGTVDYSSCVQMSFEKHDCTT